MVDLKELERGLPCALYRRFGSQRQVLNAYGAYFVPTYFESQTVRLLERPNERQSSQSGEKEKGLTAILLFMKNGALIGEIPRTVMPPSATMFFRPRSSPYVVRRGTGVVRGIDLHLGGTLLLRGEDLQVG